MQNKRENKLISYIVPIIPVALFMFLVIFMPFYAIEARLSDALYSQLEGTERNIKIITVDEETLAEYGTFTEWSREKCAELINILCADKEMAPTVIGMDFLFVSEADENMDQALIEACGNAGNVVFASNMVYRGDTKQDEDGKIYYDAWNVEMVEEPFDGLNAVVADGFANVHIATDGCVRYTKLTENFGTDTTDSFAYAIYQKYMDATGQKTVLPKSDGKGKFTFFYSGENGEYSHFSMNDVINGDIPVSEFRDAIVLVGAYAPGFQDSYVAAVEKSVPMYGVEIHANIIQALMQGKTAIAVPMWLYLFVGVCMVYAFFFVAKRQKLVPVLIETIALIALHMGVGRLLAKSGYTIPQLYFIVVLFLIMLYFIIEKYFMEKFRRKKVLSTFKKYVAPQIVDKLAKEGNFELKLGGEKRHVAVLFVDIRGFTPMSENLAPEEVVSILNEYLALTTASILDNEGTLDKFIGDATMAVFNAPFDLDDYIYRAVCTARDIAAGSQELEEKLMKRFGKTVSFGIGVNCGRAVVGNIGCDFRMDYTAIGDTVNTAARLESNAKKGQILISEYVYEAVKDRVEVTEIGEIPLKGKSKGVFVYQVDKVN